MTARSQILLGLIALACLIVFSCQPLHAGKAVPGLHVDFFGNPGLTRVYSSEMVAEPRIDGVAKGNDWGARYVGQLLPSSEGEYQLRVEADSGVRVRINGKLIIDGWACNGTRTGLVTLHHGIAADLIIEYYYDRGTGGVTPTLHLFWRPPGKAEEPIPVTAFSYQPETFPAAPIVITGTEQQSVNLSLPNGGLPPVVGVTNTQLLRTTRGQPALADGEGWTYAHHMDLAVWQGRMYAAWAMTPRDEDVPPYKVVYATSADGLQWSLPADLFPREWAWANRFYFYRAINGRMLAFSAGKPAGGNVSEALKTVLLVREITTDHRLGAVFTLIHPGTGLPPAFDTAVDTGFIAACRDALNNHPLLEQEDYGVFLGAQRMLWHQHPPSINGWQFGKAFSFYHRKDGQLVGICKMGFTTVSPDGGKTWPPPLLPPTLIAGSGKVWGQRTNDGHYALVYNPDHGKRWPLVMVSSDDGETFRAMRVIHGELPQRRYAGKYKDPGAQYVRGLAEWSNDGTFADRQACWLIYSLNKEDIWIARVPLPIIADATTFFADDFEADIPGKVIADWNIYRPCWAPVTVVTEPGTQNRCLELRDADPYDYARAVHVFPAVKRCQVTLRIKPLQENATFVLGLCDAAGKHPVSLTLTADRHLQASDGNAQHEIGTYHAGVWLTLSLQIDVDTARYTVVLNGNTAVKNLAFAENGIHTLQQLSLQTGSWRSLPNALPINPTSDIKTALPAVFLVDDVAVRKE